MARESFLRAKVTDISVVISSLNQDVTASLQEQDRCISQLNSTINEMNMITQQNATGAEETASASKEMEHQSTEMRKFVDQLALLVGENENISKVKTGPQ